MDDAAHTFEPDQTIDLEADEAKNRRVTPLRAVRQECLDCCGGSANEVRLCVSKSCPLWPFRFGRRPTDELKAEVARVLHPAELRSTARLFMMAAPLHFERSGFVASIAVMARLMWPLAASRIATSMRSGLGKTRTIRMR